jgi:hypothetical protein
MADWYVSSAAWTAIAQFAVSGVYSVGQIVRPLTAPAFAAQYAFRCTTAGTAATEPTWPANNAATVTTGGATFTNVTGQSTYGWSAAAGNLWCLSGLGAGTGRFAVGDRVFLSSDHSESSTNGVYQIAPAVAAYGVVQAISVNRTGSVPPVAADALSGAAITYTGAGTMILEPYSDTYWQGVTFTLGGSATNLQLAFNGGKSHYFKNCAFVFTTSVTTAAIIGGNPCQATLDNTTVQFNAAGQRISSAGVANYPIDFRWINTPAATLGTVPTYLFQGGGNLSPVNMITCRGVDLSTITTTLYYGGTGPIGKVLFDSCRIASGVVRLGTATYVNSADEVELVNCFDGTNILSERHTPAGDVNTDKSVTMVGGAQDDVGLYSIKLVSSSRSDPFTMTLDSFWMDVELTTTGAPRTATVEIISSASLNNTDINLMLEYQGTTGSSLGAFAYSLPSPLTPSAAVPTSTVTWNNMPSTPVKQHLQVTFTPQVAGRVRGIVRLGKVSTTVWVNPQIIIT